MNTKPSEQNQSISQASLDAEIDEFKEMNGVQKFLLFLCVALVIAALTWIILRYAVFIPENHDKKQVEQQRYEQTLQEAEEAKIAKLAQLEKEKEKKRAREEAIKRMEQKRLQRIKHNATASASAIEDKNWSLAEKLLGQLQDDQYDLVEISKLQARIDQGKDAERKILIKINTLLPKAKKLDKGVYSAEAITILDEILTLYPDHPEATMLRKKIDAYQSEFRIPEDYATITEAMPKLRAGDTIILGKGTFEFSAVLNKPVTIKGAGVGKTIVKSDTTKQSAFVFIDNKTSGDKIYELSDLTIKGTTYQDFNIDRYPLVLVKAKAKINNTYIGMSSGHGVAVLSGYLKLSNSELTANGWDGVSVRGIGAIAHITKCKIHTNYDHGVDFWNDASGSISECEIYENTGSGIVVMGKKAVTKITQVRSYKNEQCGIVAMDGGSIDLARVVAASNVLSGIVVQGGNSKANFGMVISNNNKEAGYYLDPASMIKGYQNTTSEGNAMGNLVRKALQFSIERNAE